MITLAAAHGHHRKSCGLAFWCHEPAAQMRHYSLIGHYAAVAVVLLIGLALVVTVVRWRARRKAARTRRPAYR